MAVIAPGDTPGRVCELWSRGKGLGPRERGECKEGTAGEGQGGSEWEKAGEGKGGKGRRRSKGKGGEGRLQADGEPQQFLASCFDPSLAVHPTSFFLPISRSAQCRGPLQVLQANGKLLQFGTS